MFDAIRNAAENVQYVRDVDGIAGKIASAENIRCVSGGIDLGKGSTSMNINLNGNLFIKFLVKKQELKLLYESDLMSLLKDFVDVRKNMIKFRMLCRKLIATGYGIVMPTIDELTLEEPEIIKQGGKYGVRLKASAPSIHLMKANIVTEVNPIVGSEKQSEELVMYLLNEFEESPQKLWESNICKIAA